MGKVVKEKTIHRQVCRYIDRAYPDVIYTSDASGMRLTTVGLREELHGKKCKGGWKIPDLIILHPNSTHNGLMIEVKTEVGDVYLKDGTTIKKSDHVKAQYITLQQLNKLGYKAVFGLGFDHCKKIIDNYFNN